MAAANIGRGKKGKAKRAEAKYAHQDEEDRQLALQLLDPAGPPTPLCMQDSGNSPHFVLLTTSVSPTIVSP